MQYASYYLDAQIGALLGLKNRGGPEIGLDEWKRYVFILHPTPDHLEFVALWVSGCRLFSVCLTKSSPDAQTRVHDFRMRERIRCLSEEADPLFGGIRYLSPTVAKARIPQWEELVDSRSGHDSIVFSRVSTTILPLLDEELTRKSCVGTQWINNEGWVALHIWTF